MGRGMKAVIAMVACGLADTLVVSLSDDAGDRAEAPAATEVCEEPQEYAVLCAMPEPFTTRGEARWLRELVEEHAWGSVAVVTFTPHLTRTRAIMERCWDGDILYIDSDEAIAPWTWAGQHIYQTGAFVKVAWEDGC